MTIEFYYFDLGKVLVEFDVSSMYRQMAEVSGVEPARVKEVLADGGLQVQFEEGKVSGQEFYEEFCRQIGSKPDYDELASAGSDIFSLRASIVPIVSQMQQAGYPLGILSNTCETHWEYCRRRYSILDEVFGPHALSYRVGHSKPDRAIFEAAAALAGVEPDKIFFVDDLPGHVEGARATGFDAVQFTSTHQLAADLRQRGVQINY